MSLLTTPANKNALWPLTIKYQVILVSTNNIWSIFKLKIKFLRTKGILHNMIVLLCKNYLLCISEQRRKAQSCMLAYFSVHTLKWDVLDCCQLIFPPPVGECISLGHTCGLLWKIERKKHSRHCKPLTKMERLLAVRDALLHDTGTFQSQGLLNYALNMSGLHGRGQEVRSHTLIGLYVGLCKFLQG